MRTAATKRASLFILSKKASLAFKSAILSLWERTFCHRAPCDPVPNVPPWLCHVGVEDVLPSMRTLYVQHTLGAYRLGLETGDEVVKD